MRRRRGVTIIEVMVSLVVLATGVLITLGAISYGLKATVTGTKSTEATAYARRLLEIVLAGGPRGPIIAGDTLNPVYDGTWRPLYAPDTGPADPFKSEDFVRSTDPRDLARFAENAQGYETRITLNRLTTDTNDFRYSLVQVLVELRWYDKIGRRTLQTTAVYKKG